MWFWQNWWRILCLCVWDPSECYCTHHVLCVPSKAWNLWSEQECLPLIGNYVKVFYVKVASELGLLLGQAEFPLSSWFWRWKLAPLSSDFERAGHKLGVSKQQRSPGPRGWAGNELFLCRSVCLQNCGRGAVQDKCIVQLTGNILSHFLFRLLSGFIISTALTW